MQEINAFNKATYVRNGIGKQAIFLEFLKNKLGERFEEFERRIVEKTGLMHCWTFLIFSLQLEQDKISRTWNPLLAVLPDNPLCSVFEHLGLVIDVNNSKVDKPHQNDPCWSIQLPENVYLLHRKKYW